MSHECPGVSAGPAAAAAMPLFQKLERVLSLPFDDSRGGFVFNEVALQEEVYVLETIARFAGSIYFSRDIGKILREF